MKKKAMMAGWSAGLLLAAPFLAGCEEDRGAAAQAAASNGAKPPAAIQSSNAVAQTLAQLQNAPVKQIEPGELKTPPGVGEIVRLAESGVSEEVILAFIEGSSVAYELTADDILYLYDQGLSVEIISAMIRRGNDLRDKMARADSDQEQLKESAEELKQSLAAPSPPPVEPQPEPLAEPEPVYQTSVPEAVDYATTTQPVYVNNYYSSAAASSFYSSLSPYGSWMDVGDYGWCWQPRAVVINRHWRPYSDRGRWIYSDYGWYWHSDYSWGWAPFHYGRWLDHSVHGWVWAPGSVWAPAWVTWRTYDNYCGWAPLPPGAHVSAGLGLTFGGDRWGVSLGFGLRSHHYSFVPYNRFSDRDLYPHILPATRVGGIFNKSTVVNNIIVGNNNTIINEGIGYKAVANVTRGDVPRAQVRDLPVTAGQVVKPDTLERDGSKLIVYRTQLQTERPVAAGPRTRAEQETGASPAPSVIRGPIDRPTDGIGRAGPTLERRAALPAIESVARPTRGTVDAGRSVSSLPESRSGQVATQAKRVETPSLISIPTRPDRRTVALERGALEQKASSAETLTRSRVLLEVPASAPQRPELGSRAPLNRSELPSINRPVTERGVPSAGPRTAAVPQSVPPANRAVLPDSERSARNIVSTPQPVATPPVVVRNYRYDSRRPSVTVPNYSRPAAPEPTYRSYPPPQPSYRSPERSYQPSIPEVRRAPAYSAPQPVITPSRRPSIQSVPSRSYSPPPARVYSPPPPSRPAPAPSFRSEPSRPSVSAPQSVAPASRPSAPSAPISRSGNGRERP